MSSTNFPDPRYLITALELALRLIIVTSERIVIPVCHGGYRSASTFIALESLGYPDVRNYVSAWGEWGNREDTPIVIPGA